MSGPFGKPLFGKPMSQLGKPVERENDSSSGAGESSKKYNFNFKQSALSSVADNMWSKSKSSFATEQKATPVHLEKKSLNDVLGKMAAEKEKKETNDDTPSFVFGSKIKEKVIGEPSCVANGNNDTVDPENGKGDELLKEKIAAGKSSLVAETSAESATKFREDSAQAAKDKKEEEEKALASTTVVEVTSGEENDKNLFQTACKLHLFDKERKQWVEKGLTHIRINKRTEEDGQTHYRIVARSSGNQRVLINSKIFSDMFLQRMDAKRTKLSAMGPDSTQPQVFLITISFSKTDLSSDQLFSTIEDCLAKEKSMDAGRRKRKADDTIEDSDDSNSKKERVDEGESEAVQEGEITSTQGEDTVEEKESVEEEEGEKKEEEEKECESTTPSSIPDTTNTEVVDTPSPSTTGQEEEKEV